jgi:hypothetical protein
LFLHGDCNPTATMAATARVTPERTGQKFVGELEKKIFCWRVHLA